LEELEVAGLATSGEAKMRERLRWAKMKCREEGWYGGMTLQMP
jgi:hypothetical protein